MTKPDLLGAMLSGQQDTEQHHHDQSQHIECSRKGCKNQARWQVLWNNPKIHQPERRKVWVACDEHRNYLADFLSARRFLKDIVPLDDAGDDTDGASEHSEN